MVESEPAQDGPMPILENPKHEIFAQELAKGKTATEAYKTAGFKPSRPNASRLQHQDNIKQRVSEILSEREAVHAQATARAIEQTALTKEWVIGRLRENVERSMQAEVVRDDEGKPIGEYAYQGSVANRALELLGKELGMFVDRKNVKLEGNPRDLSDAELVAILKGTGGERVADEEDDPPLTH